MTEQSRCTLCGEPMPAGEQMFKFHGYSGPCPKPPLSQAEKNGGTVGEVREAIETAQGLIKEAKGHEGADGGPITDLLDFADSWLDRALEGLEGRSRDL